MHGTRLSNGVELFETRTSKLGVTAKSASILASIIDVKVAKTDASFLVVYQGTYLHNGFYSCSGST